MRVLLILSLLSGVAQAAGVSFSRDVRPILSDHCFACHGPDEAGRMAGLRLDTEEGAVRVLRPGDAAASLLYQRVSHAQEAARMPPPSFDRKLTAEQVETLRVWINEGASWESHWSYQRPQRPEPPTPARSGWARNPIDRFVLAKLEQEGLAPSGEAAKAKLLRRLSFDLTGLPPTPEELAAFEADREPGAYERQVERLFDSPRYGERMAMRWLDLARYADTHGFHIDSHRDMWPWRDWVIAAYNANMPFDRFTVDQLAGDLLPSPTRDQIVATGFNRNHMINFEGGAIPEEYRVEYVVDRVETTAAVWLGMTMGCARCHDHKYDPIAQKDFYRFFAFFNTVDEAGLDGTKGNAKPFLALPSSEQQQRRVELERELSEARAALDEFELTRLQFAWEDTALETLPRPPEEGLIARFGFDKQIWPAKLVRGEIAYGSGRVDRSLRLDGGQEVSLETRLPVEKEFSIALWLNTGVRWGAAALDQGDLAILLGRSEKVPGEYKIAGPIEVRLGERSYVSTEAVTLREWHHVALVGGDKPRLYVDGKALVMEQGPAVEPANPGPLRVGAKGGPAPVYDGELDEIRLYDRALTPADVETLAVHQPRRAMLELPSMDCNQAEAIERYYRERFAPEPYRTAWKRIEALQEQLAALEEEIPNTMVMSEMEEPRQAFVLGRGDYRNHGEAVEAKTPAALPPLPAGAPTNRLGLARWLVAPENPLTARVEVNRQWELFFGTGLVKTAEDFGSQGEAPSHPELLDWLAVELVESGWDVRRIQRLIVTSAAYRQSSRVTPELLERDPENRLLARGPRFRLPAETVRDNALYVSGLLREHVGGPSVNPYQPPGLWEDVSYGDRFTAQSYRQDHGEALYRRSMYTFWKRTAPPPALSSFDAPNREKCTVRRARTNTPLQALALLNDPTFVEASRALAERLLSEAPSDAAARLQRAYLLALNREPNGRERDLLLTLLDRELSGYRADPDAARELLSVGESRWSPDLDPAELAAWTTVSSTILNLDETITKE
ncbi:MAG: DUF1553 domain-containing protein [Acidobacteria bacterium]|nr:DUF1553 domain-containing protein [Acidobacteriota bacterium]